MMLLDLQSNTNDYTWAVFCIDLHKKTLSTFQILQDITKNEKVG